MKHLLIRASKSLHAPRSFNSSRSSPPTRSSHPPQTHSPPPFLHHASLPMDESPSVCSYSHPPTRSIAPLCPALFRMRPRIHPRRWRSPPGSAARQRGAVSTVERLPTPHLRLAPEPFAPTPVHPRA